MKIRKLTLCAAVAILTFTFGYGVFAGVRFALSFVPMPAAKEEVADHAVNEAEPILLPDKVAQAEPVFVGPSNDRETNAEEDSAPEFDPTGEYYLDEEKVPKVFSDISYLEIQTREYDTDAKGNYVTSPIAPKGSIQTKKMLKFTRIAIGGKEIAFQTDTVGGVSYKFTGRFRSDDYCEADGDKPDLKGRLIKIKDGKWAAEMKAEFYMMCGC